MGNNAATLLGWEPATILVSTFLACVLLIVTQRWHGKHSLDDDFTGAQKLHRLAVPRIGGVGLLIGLLMGVITGRMLSQATHTMSLELLLCAAPVFVAGLLEDLTKRVRVRTRLLTSFVSAAFAIWLMDARLSLADTPIVNVVLEYSSLAFIFTVISVSGVTHSINIIDGINGLAAGTVAIMLAGLASLAWLHGDWLVMRLCVWGIAALLGFLVLNYPFGRIFLGDGGAYLAGFWLAECAVLLLVRQPAISPWAVLLVCFYPVWETVFSMYRRHVRNGVNSGQADRGHLHQLIYQRLSNTRQLTQTSDWARHGMASAIIWLMALACQALALTQFQNTAVMVGALATYACTYCLLHHALTTLPPQDRKKVADPARV